MAHTTQDLDSLYTALRGSGWRVIQVIINGRKFQVPRLNVMQITKQNVQVLIKMNCETHDEEARADVEDLLKKWELAGKNVDAQHLRDMGLWKMFSTSRVESKIFIVPITDTDIPGKIDHKAEGRGFVYDDSQLDELIESVQTITQEDPSSLQQRESQLQELRERFNDAVRPSTLPNSWSGSVTTISDPTPTRFVTASNTMAQSWQVIPSANELPDFDAYEPENNSPESPFTREV